MLQMGQDRQLRASELGNARRSLKPCDNRTQIPFDTVSDSAALDVGQPLGLTGRYSQKFFRMLYFREQLAPVFKRSKAVYTVEMFDFRGWNIIK